MTLLLGAAVLVWLAGALLTGLADTTSSPTVVTVASVDGSPDDQSSGGGPKSAGASQPHDSNSGGDAAAGHPVSSANKPDTSQGSDSNQSQAQPAAHSEPQAPGNEGNQAEPQHAAPAQPAPANTGDDRQQAAPKPAGKPDAPAGDDRQQAAPKPAAKPDATPGDSDTTRVRAVSMTARPQPGDGSLPAGAAHGAQPANPSPDCKSGSNGCGAPAMPPTPAPAPSSASGGGAGNGGANGGGAQPGIDNNARPGAPVTPRTNAEPQQPNGQVAKNKDPRSGLDPPTNATTPNPNPAAPKPDQPGTPAQSGQVPNDSTLPGLAPVGTPRVAAASAQMTQPGQALPAPNALARPVPTDDSGTDAQDMLRRLAGAGLVATGAGLTAVSAAGVLAGGAVTAGSGGVAAPLTVPEMMFAGAGIATGVGLMGKGMAMATEHSSSGALPHPRSEEPAATPLPDSVGAAPRPNSPEKAGQPEPTKTDRIKEHLTARDLDAARRELGGEVVARKSNGEPWDHVKEVRDAQNGLVKRISELKKQMEDSRTTPEQRASAEDELSEASKLLDRSEQFVPRTSKGTN